MEYWYLWLLLIVLCVITVFVLSKASAAAKKHNDERDALLREYDRKKALKEEFSFLTREKAESSDPETLFEGVSAVLQAKTEKAEDPEKVFGKFTETQKYIYTLYYRGYRERFPLVLFQKQRISADISRIKGTLCRRRKRAFFDCRKGIFDVR